MSHFRFADPIESENTQNWIRTKNLHQFCTLKFRRLAGTWEKRKRERKREKITEWAEKKKAVMYIYIIWSICKITVIIISPANATLNAHITCEQCNRENLALNKGSGKHLIAWTLIMIIILPLNAFISIFFWYYCRRRSILQV